MSSFYEIRCGFYLRTELGGVWDKVAVKVRDGVVTANNKLEIRDVAVYDDKKNPRISSLPPKASTEVSRSSIPCMFFVTNIRLEPVQTPNISK